MTTKTKQVKTMSKRVSVYSKNLKVYINLITDEIRKNSEVVETFSDDLVPPYPVLKLEDVKEKYHASTLMFTIESSLKQFYKDLKNLKDSNYAEILTCIEIYTELPSRNSGVYGNKQEGVEVVTFSEEMLLLSHEIANHLIKNKYKISNIRRAGVTSDKIISSLAIIYTGRLLQKNKEKEEDAKPNSDSN